MYKAMNFSTQFLVAMPRADDSYFSGSLTLVCNHTAEGAYGIVLNRSTDIYYRTVFEELKIDCLDSRLAQTPALSGGPVRHDRALVLHAPTDEVWAHTVSITNNILLTSSRDIIEAIGRGLGPKHMLLVLGYTGWGAGQLEAEMMQNAWLPIRADENTLYRLIYETPIDKKIDGALTLLGISRNMLSGVTGHA